jgi:D-glycero-D-manno-heptose 1,7-bisphosphate phosphatase
MLRRAAAEWTIDLSSSFVVGDKYSDVEAGFRAGAGGILVLSGCGQDEYERHAQWPRQPDCVATDLAAAVDWILGSAA